MKKLMVMVAALAMLTSSAYAADWDFYGSARIATFYGDIEPIGATVNPGGDSISTYAQALQGNSRIGANVKVSDELTARFEYGTGVNVRILYGEWNFGAGKLLVGQTYSPLQQWVSNQVFESDAGLLAYGGVYSGREQMLRLKFGGFTMAFLPAAQGNTGTATTSAEVKFPAIEASYTMNFDTSSLRVNGGYQKYDTMVGVASDDVSSWVVAAGGNISFGAFWTAANIYAGSNAGNMISLETNADGGWDDGLANITAAGVVQDNEAFGVVLAAGWTINDMFGLEAGYGYAKTELDINASQRDEVSAYYLNSTITMAPGVFFVPEIGFIDGDEDATALRASNEITYFGIKWQINF